MHIKEEIKSLLSFSYLFEKSSFWCHLVLKLIIMCIYLFIKTSVNVQSCKGSSIVSSDDSIDIHHGYYFENKPRPQLFSDLTLAAEESDETVDNPTRVSLTRVNTTSEKQGAFLFISFRKICDSYHRNWKPRECFTDVFILEHEIAIPAFTLRVSDSLIVDLISCSCTSFSHDRVFSL